MENIEETKIDLLVDDINIEIPETRIEPNIKDISPPENKIYYSKSLNGFIFAAFHKEMIKEEDIEITKEEHESLMNGLSEGKILYQKKNGRPGLKDRDPPTQEQIDNLNKRLRSEAYVSEADPLFFKSQRGEATIQEWQDKIEEIRSRYPVSSETPEVSVK